MMGRHSAALLCVLLLHALFVFLLLSLRPPPQRRAAAESFESAPIHIYLQPLPSVAEPEERVITQRPAAVPAAPPAAPAAQSAASAPQTTAITPPQNVDWPLEGRRAAARVLAAEAEAERIAKMFSGPSGTWASLTPRERSQVKKFRWKPSGLEVDQNGNTIYHIDDRCVLVNFSFIGCSFGKIPAYGDLFKQMREYFDEQRLPETGQGNGR